MYNLAKEISLKHREKVGRHQSVSAHVGDPSLPLSSPSPFFLVAGLIIYWARTDSA